MQYLKRIKIGLCQLCRLQAVRERCLPSSASKTAQATLKHSQHNICCCCRCCFGSTVSLALKNVLAQLSFCQTANFLPEEKNKMAEVELQMFCQSRSNGSGGKKVIFPTSKTRGTQKSVIQEGKESLVKKKFLLQAGVSPAEGFIGVIILKLLTVSSAIIHWDFVRQEKTAVFFLLNVEGYFK